MTINNEPFELRDRALSDYTLHSRTVCNNGTQLYLSADKKPEVEKHDELSCFYAFSQLLMFYVVSHAPLYYLSYHARQELPSICLI